MIDISVKMNYALSTILVETQNLRGFLRYCQLAKLDQLQSDRLKLPSGLNLRRVHCQDQLSHFSGYYVRAGVR